MFKPLSFIDKQTSLALSCCALSVIMGIASLVAQVGDPFGSSIKNTATPPPGIAAELEGKFTDETPLPTNDFFIGELGEAYSALSQLPFLTNKELNGWRDFTLNMSYQDIRALINSSTYPWLTIKDDYEPFLRTENNVFFVDTYANHYFHSVQFLLDTEQRLYLIRLRPRAETFSFLELLSQLQKKYGRPSHIGFAAIRWEDATGHNIELRRDSSIRYIRAGILTASRLNPAAPIETSSSLETTKAAFKTELLEDF